MEEFGIERLPKDCIAHIISLTSPPDACRCAGVSSAFRAAAGSDAVWERFLPPDYQSLLDRSADPIDPSSSKRDLFFRLRDWVLLDGGRMGVRLELSSGAKCFMLPARTSTIGWIEAPQYWRWIPLAHSRFSEAAVLIAVCWLHIRGTIQSNILTRNTTYEVFLVFKLTNWSRGFDEHPQEASVALGLQSSTRIVRLLSNYTSDIPFPPMNGDENDDDDDVDNDDDHVADVGVNDDDNAENADDVVDDENAEDVDNEDDVVADDNDHGVDDDDVDNNDNNDHGVDVVDDDDDNDNVDNADDFDNGDNVVDDDNDDNDDVDNADDFDNEEDVVDDDNDDVDNVDDFDNEDDVVDDDDHGVDDNAGIRVRDDGWLEFSMGNVYNEEGEDGEMTMTFTGVEALYWKSGLVVLGIEIRPII